VLGQRHSRRDALARIPLFGGLDRHDLDAVERISTEQDVEPGEVLIHEGEPGRHFFVLLEGEAEVSRDGRMVNRLGPGDFFGEISLLSDRPTTASVATIGPARVVVIAPAAFRLLLQELPLMQMKIVRTLADRLPDDFYYGG
jgi:CRP/FNR family transcriptional regulator, cyclic AMP receptor protein